MRNNPFSDRTVSQTLTGEFLEIACDFQDTEEVEDALDTHTKDIENSYSCVVAYTESNRVRDGYEIVAIRTKDSLDDTIKRAMQDLQHRLTTES